MVSLSTLNDYDNCNHVHHARITKKYPSKAVTPSGDTFKAEETEYNKFGAVREPKA